MTDDGMFFWAGNRFPAGLDERIETARSAGCSAMSLFPLDVRRARTHGTSAAELAARAVDAGVPVRVLDPLTRWVPRWQPPPTLSAENRAFVDVDEDEFLTMAQALGVASISVIEAFGAPIGIDEATQAFARICDKAGDLGLRVHLEFLPWSAINDLRSAWDIVHGADRPNGGLVLDSWHFQRSRSRLSDLKNIPGDRVFVVQLSDGPATPSEDLAEESNSGRLLPGQGDFDLSALMATLHEIQGLTSVGPEVFSLGLWQRPPHDAGRDLGAATRTAITSGTGRKTSHGGLA